MDLEDIDFFRKRPVRIILVRHGESEGNVDETVYGHVADSKVALTAQGRQQAEAVGRRIREMIEEDGNDSWRVHFYVSPYKRTLQTLKYMGRAFDHSRMVGVREEPRIREQDFGNFQVPEQMRKVKHARERFGKFFFRFPEGESAADVYDRVTGFLESLWRDILGGRLHRDPSTGKGSDLNIILVTHGLTMRVFLTRWFKWTTKQFEGLNNPGNCEMRVMQLGKGGEYSLAPYHSREELEKWGLSDWMIGDQEWRSKENSWKSRRVERQFNCAEFFGCDSDEDEASDKIGECMLLNGSGSRSPKLQRLNTPDPDLRLDLMGIEL